VAGAHGSPNHPRVRTRDEIADFGQIVLIVAAGFSLALLGRTITERLAIPSAAVFLLAAAVASDVTPALGEAMSFVTVERVGVVAVIVILFDGGMHIGWRQAAVSLVPIVSLVILGTFANGRPDRARRTWPARLLLDHERTARSRTRTDRSCRDLLRARRPRDPRANGHDPAG